MWYCVKPSQKSCQLSEKLKIPEYITSNIFFITQLNFWWDFEQKNDYSKNDGEYGILLDRLITLTIELD